MEDLAESLLVDPDTKMFLPDNEAVLALHVIPMEIQRGQIDPLQNRPISFLSLQREQNIFLTLGILSNTFLVAFTKLPVITLILELFICWNLQGSRR